MRQTVDVLIGATLPWAAWVAEVDCMPSAVNTCRCKARSGIGVPRQAVMQQRRQGLYLSDDGDLRAFGIVPGGAGAGGL